MKAVFAIILSLAFALQGNSMSCLDGLCQIVAADDCCDHDSSLSKDCCCAEASTNSEDCPTGCDLESHQHQPVVLYEQGTQIAAPELRLLALFEISDTFAPTKEPIVDHPVSAPPMRDYSVGYCVWRL
ncbi:MAG: hypothetical protein ACSHYA_12225 [Opitutaceae bacterium]